LQPATGREGEAEDEGKTDTYQKGAQKPEAKTAQEKRQEKKERQKTVLNASYDGGKTYYDEVKHAMQEQLDFNKSEFEGEDESLRVQFEGFRPGLYVRIEMSHIPYKMVEFFNSRSPVIASGLIP
jgi:ribosome biogenesis protein BMS1